MWLLVRKCTFLLCTAKSYHWQRLTQTRLSQELHPYDITNMGSSSYPTVLNIQIRRSTTHIMHWYHNQSAGHAWDIQPEGCVLCAWCIRTP